MGKTEVKPGSGGSRPHPRKHEESWVRGVADAWEDQVGGRPPAAKETQPCQHDVLPEGGRGVGTGLGPPLVIRITLGCGPVVPEFQKGTKGDHDSTSHSPLTKVPFRDPLEESAGDPRGFRTLLKERPKVLTTRSRFESQAEVPTYRGRML